MNKIPHFCPNCGAKLPDLSQNFVDDRIIRCEYCSYSVTIPSENKKLRTFKYLVNQEYKTKERKDNENLAGVISACLMVSFIVIVNMGVFYGQLAGWGSFIFCLIVSYFVVKKFRYYQKSKNQNHPE